MPEQEQESSKPVRLTDPRALRAYAHPVRLALVALLRQDGPQTATGAARALGESVDSCSFHLRQLAKYGLVEQAGGGVGREKPWRATAMVTVWDGAGDGTGEGAGDGAGSSGPVADAAQALHLTLARQYFELLTRWLRTQDREPAEWRDAAHFGDSLLHLTAAELAELGEKIEALVEPYRGRLGDPAARPAETRPVLLLHLAFPSLLSGGDGRADSDLTPDA
jgi:hypothetical protein